MPPLIVPQIAFLFGLQILFCLCRARRDFHGAGVVHLVFVFPYVLLSLCEPWAPGTRVTAMRSARSAAGRRGVLGGAAADAVPPRADRHRARLRRLRRALSPDAADRGGRWPTIATEAVALASGGDPRLIGATGWCRRRCRSSASRSRRSCRRCCSATAAACGPPHEPSQRGWDSGWRPLRSNSTAKCW